MSARNCIVQSLAAMPPSDAQAVIASPQSRHRADEVARLVADRFERCPRDSCRPHSAVRPESAPRASGDQ